jgi:hypothetical protein
MQKEREKTIIKSKAMCVCIKHMRLVQNKNLDMLGFFFFFIIASPNYFFF